MKVRQFRIRHPCGLPAAPRLIFHPPRCCWNASSVLEPPMAQITHPINSKNLILEQVRAPGRNACCLHRAQFFESLRCHHPVVAKHDPWFMTAMTAALCPAYSPRALGRSHPMLTRVVCVPPLPATSIIRQTRRNGTD